MSRSLEMADKISRVELDSGGYYTWHISTVQIAVQLV